MAKRRTDETLQAEVKKFRIRLAEEHPQHSCLKEMVARRGRPRCGYRGYSFGGDFFARVPWKNLYLDLYRRYRAAVHRVSTAATKPLL